MNNAQLHIHAFGEDEPTISLETDIIPRVGDEVSYWLDWPKHMGWPSGGIEGTDPEKVSGKVSKVVFCYRQMDGWGSRAKLVEFASVWLENAVVTLVDGTKRDKA